MKKITKSILTLALGLMSLSVWGESEYCDYAVNHNGDNTQQIAMTWTTLDNGDVQITIAPKVGDSEVTFRNGGLENTANNVDNISISTDNFVTSTPASTYFTRGANPNGTTTYILKRKGTASLPAGAQIRSGSAIAWRGGTSGDMWNTNNFTYTYGTVCGSELSTPSITSIVNDVISFADVENATYYKAYIYKGSSFVTALDITSGSEIHCPLYLAGTYQVRLRAFNSTQYSDFSESYDWEITSNNSAGNLPQSSVNKQRILNGDNTATEIYVSLETDLITGNILGIISPINAEDEDYVYWREDAIRLDGFKYNGESFTDYFDAEYHQPQIQNADEAKIKIVHFYPKTTGEHIPTYGGIISYSGGTLVWHYNNNGTYTGGVVFPDYIYGTGCGTLSRPIISELTSAGVISFSAVQEATSYKAYVYNSSMEQVYEQTVTSGGCSLNYIPYLAGNYKVGVRAFNNSDGTYSAMSALSTWSFASNNTAGNLPLSSVNKLLVSDGNSAHNVYVSLETDIVTGNILGTISPVNAADEDYVYWREDAIRLDGFKYNGESFTDYFDAEYVRYTSEIHDADNAKVKIVHFYPKTEGSKIPTFGGTISYSGGTLVWHYNNGGAYKEGFSFPDYIYGAGCGTLLRPIISSITSAGVISFSAIPEATSYKAYVYNSSLEKVYEQTVTNGGTINYHPYISDTYKVYLQAAGADDAYSAYSAPVDWALEGNVAYLPQSEWCETLYEISANESEDVNVTWSTDRIGNIIVTLTPAGSNTQESTAFRGGAMNVDNLKIGDLNLSSYFTSSYSNNVNTFTLIDPTSKPNYGATIRYDGQVIYKTGTHTNAWPTMHFEYIYGSTCNGYNDHVNPTITALSVVSKDVTSVTLHVEATDVDDLGSSHAIASYSISSENHGFVTTAVTPDGDGNFTVSGLKDNETYTFIIHAFDLIGNEGTRNIEVVLPFNTNFNLAKNQPCTGGYCQFSDHTSEGDANQHKKANDGDEGTSYSAYGAPSTDDAWWSVNLGEIYDLAHVDVYWESDFSTGYAIYGSLDNSNWYLIGKDAATAAGLKSTIVAAPAQYVKVHSYKKKDVVFAEVKVYASGLSTLTDSKPVLTYAQQVDITSSQVSFEVGGVDITTHPVQYYVTGVGEPQTLSATNNIIEIAIEANTDYNISIAAKDGSGNLSDSKAFVIGSSGAPSGIFVRSSYSAIGWGTGDGDLKAANQLLSTTEVGIYAVTIPMTAGTYAYKLYNKTASRWTNGDNSGTTDRPITLTADADVTFYATSEDFFYSNYDAFVLTGTAVGEGEKALVWNADHSIATWSGTITPNGNFMLSYTNNAHPFYAEAQTFDGDYTYGTFTLDLTKMTGTWSYVALSFADDAANNTSIVADNDGRIANVTINRGLINDGYWYTLCLPFDMSAEQMTETFGTGYTLAMMTGAEDRGSLIHLNFDYVNELSAGKPYLFKPGNKDFQAGSIIEGVTIKNADPSVTPQKSENVYMHFQGTFNKQTFTAESNPDVRFLADDNYLLSPANDGSDVGAFRCYFTIPASSPAPGRAARIVVGAQVPTEIGNVENENAPCTKVLREGQLLILRDGRTYNAQGIMVKSE